MSNKNAAIGIALGLAIGAVVGVAAALMYGARSEERARELLMEKEQQARYRSPEYAERARAAISEARKRVKNKSA